MQMLIKRKCYINITLIGFLGLPWWLTVKRLIKNSPVLIQRRRVSNFPEGVLSVQGGSLGEGQVAMQDE